MRRPLLQRLFAAVFAPWFAVVMTEPVAMDACPMHSGAMAGAHAVMAHMDGADGAMRGHALASHDTAPHAPSHGSHQCCCVGCGCCAGVVALPPVPAPDWGSQALRTAPVADVVGRAPATAVEHRLPFANGPPSARV